MEGREPRRRHWRQEVHRAVGRRRHDNVATRCTALYVSNVLRVRTITGRVLHKRAFGCFDSLMATMDPKSRNRPIHPPLFRRRKSNSSHPRDEPRRDVKVCHTLPIRHTSCSEPIAWVARSYSSRRYTIERQITFSDEPEQRV